MTKEKILAIDPGAVNHGVAFFVYNTETRTANNTIMKVLKDDEGLKDILETLRDASDLIVVLEEFTHAYAQGNFRGKHSSRMTKNEYKAWVTCKKIKAMAVRHGHKLVSQEPRILGPARVWANNAIGIPKGHIPDHKSAWIHGVYFMLRSNRIDTVKQVFMKGAQQDGFEGMGDPSDNEERGSIVEERDVLSSEESEPGGSLE